MTSLQDRFSRLGQALSLPGAYAIAVGAASIVASLAAATNGEMVALCRVILGVGVGAGVLSWTPRRAGIDGWRALLGGSIAQLPLVA